MRALAWALLCSASQAAECSEGDEEESVCMLQLRSSVQAQCGLAPIPKESTRASFCMHDGAVMAWNVVGGDLVGVPCTESSCCEKFASAADKCKPGTVTCSTSTVSRRSVAPSAGVLMDSAEARKVVQATAPRFSFAGHELLCSHLNGDFTSQDTPMVSAVASAPACATGRQYNTMQTMVYDCDDTVLPAGSQFCLHGRTFTVEKSWASVANGRRGATVNLRSPDRFPRNFFQRNDPLSPGACGGVVATASHAACMTGRQYNTMQLMVYNCDDDVLPAGSKFCLHGRTFTVAKSWASVANGQRGATVNLEDPERFPRNFFERYDPLAPGACA